MEVRRITFKEPFPEPHISIDCWPPFAESNPIYAAAAHSFIQPYTLAIEMGRIEEKTALRFFAQAYAEGVIANCTSPGFKEMKGHDWTEWLLAHPEHFEELREILECRDNWSELKEVPHGASGSGQS